MKNYYIHGAMNFLAHIYLSGDNTERIIGNFIGDFVKGKTMKNYPEGIQEGILLHRKIDQFTDQHEIVLKSKKRLRPKYRHYAPVIVDVFYDHFLALHWEHYHSTKLDVFTSTFYQLIRDHLDQLPEPAQYMFSYMSKHDWLYNYRFIDGIHQALSGMSRRTKFESGMETSSQELKENYALYEEEFRQFFPLLQEMSNAYISD